jgi:electron transfer flavoprotein alpha subunit
MSNRDAPVWVLAEHADGQLARVGFDLLGRGRRLADALGAPLWAVVVGPAFPDPELRRLHASGADGVLTVEHDALRDFLVEPYAACLEDLVRRHAPQILIAAATSTGRTLMPYLAVKLHTGLTADCTELDIDPATGDLLQTRPAIGGHILATIRTPRHRPQMATVRPHSTRPPPPDPTRTGRLERSVPAPDLLRSRVRHTGFLPSPESRTLQDAEIVVSVGRGIRRPENLPLVRQLADSLEGALGATRDVVDRGWLDYPHQVGLSGKTVAPRLYLAVGLSGSVQHLAGMQTSDTIIAINSDPEAQILKVAELGLVGDLFDILPVLIEKLRRARAQAGQQGGAAP